MFLTVFLASVLITNVVLAAPQGDYDENANFDKKLDLGLDNLGEQIQQQVEYNLRPVRAMEMQLKMKNGVGGVTVVTFSPSGKQYIIKQNGFFECSGTVDKGQCSGSLRKFEPTEREDYCYVRSYSQTNDQLCLSFGPVSFSSWNGRVKCESFDDQTPALLISVSDYNKLCEGVAKEVTFKYYADESDPAHVVIPNSNPFVKCDSSEPGICEFTESNVRPNVSGNVQISSGNGGIQINSQNGGSFVQTGPTGSIQINTGW